MIQALNVVLHIPYTFLLYTLCELVTYECTSLEVAIHYYRVVSFDFA